VIYAVSQVLASGVNGVSWNLSIGAKENNA